MPFDPRMALQALKSQNRNQAPDYTSAWDDPDAELLRLQSDRADELTRNLGREGATPGSPSTPPVQPGQEDTNFGNRRSHGTTFDAAGTLSDLAHLNRDVASNPLTAQGQQVDAINAGNLKAILNGFGGTRDISIDRDHPDPSTGLPMTAGAVGDTHMPMQREGEYNAQLAGLKTQMPLLVEQEKSRNDLNLQNNQMQTMMKAIGMRSGQTGAPGTPGAAETPTSPSYTVKSDAPYNGVMDLLKAKSNKFMGEHFATNQSKIIQEGAYKLLASMQGLIPGNRGLTVALPAMREHLDKYGDETPSSTYLRTLNLRPIYSAALQELEDPTLSMRFSPEGKLSLAQDPQMIMRAKEALKTAMRLNEDQMGEMKRLYPGIEGGISNATTPETPASHAPNASRFERIR